LVAAATARLATTKAYGVRLTREAARTRAGPQVAGCHANWGAPDGPA